jgi:hypothetical protein
MQVLTSVYILRIVTMADGTTYRQVANSDARTPVLCISARGIFCINGGTGGDAATATVALKPAGLLTYMTSGTVEGADSLQGAIRTSNYKVV